jgi:uncharacterized protein (TIGR00255 family)
MNLQSMTGFGKASRENEQLSITVEIKSLNSKGFDLSIRLPFFFKEKEMELRNELQKFLERGKIELYVSTEYKQNQSGIKINTEIAKDYYHQLKSLSEELNEKQNNLFSEILKMPDVIKSDKKELNEEDWNLVKETIFEAVNAMQKFRKDEGKSIATDFNSQINSISKKLEEVKIYDTERIDGIKNRIRNNLLDVVSKNAIDENRFEQELIYYIEKIDINEEKVRLATHCNYFISTMKEPACGRKLNFIAQEIGREINTIGSKANDARIQRLVVEMKDELEKIKEQTNNVL